MCVTKEVSMGVFLICTITCFYLYRRNNKNDRWIAVLFGYLGSMQFLEYLMWSDQDCTGLNQWATNVGINHNILQPLLSFGIAYYYTNGKIPMYIYILLLIYIITSLPKILKMKEPEHCSMPCGKDKYGLSWPYTNTSDIVYVWFIFCIALAAPCLLMKNDGRIYASIIIGTYILAYFISNNRCPNAVIPPNGSWWCFMAALVPLFTLFKNK